MQLDYEYMNNNYVQQIKAHKRAAGNAKIPTMR